MTDLHRTPLYDLHLELGAKMVPFAGYEMPVQYPAGVMKEHLHTRAAAGLFDVSHMGQVLISGSNWEEVASAFETLVPQNVLGLADGRQRYGFFTTPMGGIADDLMFARRGDALFVVINAACKEDDIAHMRANLPASLTIDELDRALIALQGPASEAVLAALDPAAADMRFMDVRALTLDGIEVWASRSGYTGEDGYEISVAPGQATPLARKLLEHTQVEPIGLGARDSLRLEAGLCLYGHDIDTTTTPVEAGLSWAIQTIRRAGGARAGGFPGADIILPQLTAVTERSRVGLLPEGRAPMREGVPLFSDLEGGEPVGHITSGGFGPTVGGPVAMGYLPTDLCAPGTHVFGELRGKRLPLVTTPLPFVAANFKR
ncbi:glycine cleavage system aminomethyltransferase GcvT [Aestuariivita boseongensis]|uniref:glycine cleavage system aminomethyltransferase GcvT n=1 Tax=Aestuariivita boseongensis TaxID=1470562 RepID=UPI000680DD21|nr:glycine cleavage system aminomethyltransferase GcvT [Aestuariivita boseongensis]